MRRKAVLIAATLTASLVGAFAGVDLSQPDPVRAVVDQLDALVTQLENEIA